MQDEHSQGKNFLADDTRKLCHASNDRAGNGEVKMHTSTSTTA